MDIFKYCLLILIGGYGCLLVPTGKLSISKNNNYFAIKRIMKLNVDVNALFIVKCT